MSILAEPASAAIAPIRGGGAAVRLRPSPAQEAVEVFGYVFLASGWDDEAQMDALEMYRDAARDGQRKAIYSLALGVVFRRREARDHFELAAMLATDPQTRATALAELHLIKRVGTLGYRAIRRFRRSGEWFSSASRRPALTADVRLPLAG